MKKSYLLGKKINPKPIEKGMQLSDLIDNTMPSYNGGRLRQACQLFVQKMLEEDTTVGLSLTGALTPTGLGISCIIPLIQHGFVDWIISTGANLYHDAHFGIGLSLHEGNHNINDVELREDGVVRIYDIFFSYSVLLDTDAFFRNIMESEEFDKSMSSAEFHYLCGKYVFEREKLLGTTTRSLLSAAYQFDVPIYTSSPGDSSIGMNIAAMSLKGKGPKIDIARDVNETAAIIYNAKKNKRQKCSFYMRRRKSKKLHASN